MLLRSFRTRRWQAAFQARYPGLEAVAPEQQRLRLILGVGRSGTSWVSQMLFKTPLRSRCFSEPLFHMTPRLPFHRKGDHTAVRYENIPARHPLLRAYGLLAHRQFDPAGLHGVVRDEAGWEICLVKEVHALLAAEGLLRAWGIPTVFILRDPIYVIDSLLAAQTLQTNYLDHEIEAVQEPAFLKRFAPDREEVLRRVFAEAARQEPRRQIIQRKVLCAQLLQEMFLALAAEFPCANTWRYEQCCQAPEPSFRAIAEALSIPWDDAMKKSLAETTQADATSSQPYSIVRNTAQQTDRPLKFFSSAEAALCRAALAAIRSDSGGVPR
jgi:hypothetical protein